MWPPLTQQASWSGLGVADPLNWVDRGFSLAQRTSRRGGGLGPSRVLRWGLLAL